MTNETIRKILNNQDVYEPKFFTIDLLEKFNIGLLAGRRCWSTINAVRLQLKLKKCQIGVTNEIKDFEFSSEKNLLILPLVGATKDTGVFIIMEALGQFYVVGTQDSSHRDRIYKFF